MSKSLYFKRSKSTCIKLDVNSFDTSKQQTTIIAFKPTVIDSGYRTLISNSLIGNMIFDIELINGYLQYWEQSSTYYKICKVEENKPYILAIVNNLNDFKFYVNGELLHQRNINVERCNSIIGRYGTNDQIYDGYISYYKLYDKCLDISEILEEQYSNNIHENMIRFYNFNTIAKDKNIVYAVDKSKNKKNVVITNFIGLSKDFIDFNYYLIEKDSKFYNIDASNLQNDKFNDLQIKDINADTFKIKGFRSLYSLFSKIKTKLKIDKQVKNIKLNKYINTVKYLNKSKMIPKVVSSPGLFESGDGTNLINPKDHSAFFCNDVENGSIEFIFPESICLKGLILSWNDAGFKTGTWKFCASNDGKKYVDLIESFEYGSDTTSAAYKCSNNEFYKYYKIQQIGGSTSRNSYLHDIVFIDETDYTLYGLLKYNNKFYSINHEFDLIDINSESIDDTSLFKNSGFEISEKINFEKILKNKDIELYLYYEDYKNPIYLNIEYDIKPIDLFKDNFKLLVNPI